MKSKVTLVYLEPPPSDPSPVQGPVKAMPDEPLGGLYRRLFAEYPTAEALWVLLPGSREPFRIHWRSMYKPRSEARKGKGKGKGKSAPKTQEKSA